MHIRPRHRGGHRYPHALGSHPFGSGTGNPSGAPASTGIPGVVNDHWVRKLARLRARQLPEQVLQLCDDMSAKQRPDRAKLDVARLRLADAETGGEQKEPEAAEAELVAAQEAFDDVSVTLAFRALPRPTLDGLIRERPPAEDNSNDSTWLANADRPLTGYERVWGSVATPRSLRTRGAVEDVAARAAWGRLTVADLQRQRTQAAGGRRYGGARCLEQDRGTVERGGRRLPGGHARVQPHPGGRLGRRPLSGGAHPADVQPVLEPALAVLRRPDPDVPRSAGSRHVSASGTSSRRRC